MNGESSDTTEAREKLRLLTLYRQTMNPRFLAAAQQLRGGAVVDYLAKKPKRGRPSTDAADLPLLYQMAEAVLSGTKIFTAAGRFAEAAAGGGTTLSKARRLDRKYSEESASIERAIDGATRGREAMAAWNDQVARAVEDFRRSLGDDAGNVEKSAI
ncbi:hypothetical protein [Geminicoccus harenae]|uniref:hypothetical protein n=1 Tax=Geminicoccus harenae TaxID=2498453 RepID=UPI00168B3A09|nr:hypothetical protein [Geminicoccus harenae]